MNLASTLLTVLGLYLGLGFLFALLFLLANGPKRMDPAADGAGIGFRLLILPGAAIFWPYLLYRWISRRPPPSECSRHRRAAASRLSASTEA